MLIVGGTAALTAIAVYLAWHFLRQWRASWRQRRIKRMQVIADGMPEAPETQRMRDARELHLVR